MRCVARMIDGRMGDKYQLTAVLGEGATGTVYAAKNLMTQRRVAIKSLHLRPGLHAGNPEIQRFEQEARIAGSIDSPHIAQVLDVADDPATGLPFLVMELLRGEDIQSLLDRVGPLPVDVALRIAAQACAGLVAAHAAGVIHRDIKPANIFLAKQDPDRIVVKILDFGIAKIRRVSDASVHSQALPAPAVSMTESGQMLGSPLFMAPEQVDEIKHVDGRADQFSLAITLFTMLAGTPPHADVKSFPKLLQRLVTTPPPPIRSVANGVPVEVETFLQKATALNRDKRFSNVEEMLAALEALLPNGADIRENMLVGRNESTRATDKAKGGDRDAPIEQPEESPSGPKARNIGDAADPYAATVPAPVEHKVADTLVEASKPTTIVSPVEPRFAATLASGVDSVSMTRQTPAAPNRAPIVMVVVLVVITLVVALLVVMR